MTAQVYVVGLEYSYEPGEHLGVNATLEGAQQRASEHYTEPTRNTRGEPKPLEWEQHCWTRSIVHDGQKVHDPPSSWLAYGGGGEYWIALEEIGP